MLQLTTSSSALVQPSFFANVFPGGPLSTKYWAPISFTGFLVQSRIGFCGPRFLGRRNHGYFGSRGNSERHCAHVRVRCVRFTVERTQPQTSLQSCFRFQVQVDVHAIVSRSKCSLLHPSHLHQQLRCFSSLVRSDQVVQFPSVDSVLNQVHP